MGHKKYLPQPIYMLNQTLGISSEDSLTEELGKRSSPSARLSQEKPKLLLEDLALCHSFP